MEGQTEEKEKLRMCEEVFSVCLFARVVACHQDIKSAGCEMKSSLEARD